jgi:hypothetical protein
LIAGARGTSIRGDAPCPSFFQLQYSPSPVNVDVDGARRANFGHIVAGVNTSPMAKTTNGA